MATLSGNKIKDTYQSLVKFSDNGNITTSAKQLTDGFGNNSPMFVSTTQVGIGVTPESGLNLHVFGDAKIGSNLTVIGNLVVEGSTTTVGTDTLTVKDPLIVLANNNTSTDAVDIGFYGKYHPSGTTLYSGLFREALTGKYRLFKGLEVEPTTTVNTSGTGYAVASLVANLEGNVTGNLIGSVTGGTFSGTLLSNVVATTQSANDNSTKVATTAYVDNQVGLYDTLSEVLANGNTSGANDIIIEDSQKVNYGTGSDLQIYHDATDSYIKNDTGNLIIEQTTDDADIIFKNDNGSGDTIEYFRIDGSESRVVYGRSIHMADNVSIFLGNDDDGLIRYDSTADKILHTGTSQFSNDLTVVGDAVFNGNINLDDDERIRLGTSNAFQLYYDSTLESGQGGAVINSTRIFVGVNFFQLNSVSGENMIKATSNGNVELYYDNSKKLETTSTGVSITGNINIGDNEKIIFGDGGDIEMFFNSSTFVIDDTSEVQQGIDIDTNRVRFRGTDLYMEIGNAQHTFWTNGTQRLQINSSGVNVSSDFTVNTDTLFVDYSADSVGIGLTNPSDYSADELVISVPDDSGMTLVSGTTDTAYIRFADGTAAADQANFISHDHNTNTLTIFSQAKVSIGILEAEVAYFTDTNFYVDKSTTIDDNLFVDGNVGIGTTLPQSKLHIQTEAAPTDIYLTDGTVGSDNYGGVVRGFSVAGQGGRLQLGTLDNDVYYPTITLLQQGGNVGIGETNPQRPLHINGTEGVARFTSTASGNNGFEVGIGTSSQAFLWQSENSYMQFATNNTERMRIDSSGNLLLNTATSRIRGGGTTTGRLEMANNDSTSYMMITGSANANPNLIYFVNNAAVTLTLNQDNTATFAGNVGIGGTPSRKLDVRDSSDTQNTILAYNQGASFTGTVYEAITDRTANAAFNLMNLKASTSSKFLVRGDGNVGIGTATPVNGKLVLSSLQSNSSNYTWLLFDNQASGYGDWNMYKSGNNNLAFGYGTSNGGSYTNALTLAFGGNVGIGTTSPATKLHVVGTIKLGGYSYIGEDLSDTDSLTIASDHTESIHFAHFTPATSTYSTNMIIDSSGNVGIGTDSPQQLLHINNTSGDFGAEAVLRGSTSTGTPKSEIAFKRGSSGDGAEMVLRTSNSSGTIQDVMTLDTSGNVGIGVTPANWNTITPIQVKNSAFAGLSSGNTHVAYMSSNFFYQSGDKYIANGQATVYTQANGKHSFYSAPENTSGAGAALTFTERMRITSDGDFIFNTGSTSLQTYPTQGSNQVHASGSTYFSIGHVTGSSSGNLYMGFGYNGNGIGSITQNGTTGVSYNTSSDYRLKENVVEMTGALDRVSQLKPSRFNFIADADTTVDGFLAHEVQEIVPEAISGEKDAMRDEEYEVTPAIYEDVVHPAEEAVYETIEHSAIEEELDDEGNVIVEGKEAYTEEVLVTEAKEEWTEKVLVSEKVMGTREVPDYQGIDQSKLVPLLVGAIQEQQQIINDLKSRIETLENN